MLFFFFFQAPHFCPRSQVSQQMDWGHIMGLEGGASGSLWVPLEKGVCVSGVLWKGA